MRVLSALPRISLAVPVRGDGTFEFTGLPGAQYDVTPETRDFEVPEPVRGLLVDRDVSDLTITLEAAKKVRRTRE